MSSRPPATDAGSEQRAEAFPDQPDEQHPVLRRLQTGSTSVTNVGRAAMWATLSRLSSQLLIFLGTVVTARLLDPSDFGKVAIIFPVTTFAMIFTSLGLGSSVIHAEHVTEEHLSTAFWLNTAAASVLTVIVAGLSVPLSMVYNDPELVPLLCLASLMFGLDLRATHMALLERTLRFKTIARIETGATFLNVAVTIVAALLGTGAYSLVLGPVAYTVSATLATFVVVRWRPHRRPDRESARAIWVFSRGFTGFNLLNFWSRNADNLLLAGVVSQTQLGYYSRAYNLMRLPVLQMGLVMNRVMFPALTRMREDTGRLADAWVRSLAVASAVMAPVTIGTAVAAPALTEVLYGTTWLPMVPVLQLLALSALPQILTTTVGGLLKSTGATDVLFKLGLITSALSIAAIAAGLPWGTVGVATTLLVKFYLEVLISIPPCLRQIGLRARDFLRALRGVLLACVALAVVGMAIRLLVGDREPAWVVLLAQIAACGVAYAVVLRLTDHELVTRIVNLVKKERTKPPKVKDPASIAEGVSSHGS